MCGVSDLNNLQNLQKTQKLSPSNTTSQVTVKQFRKPNLY